MDDDELMMRLRDALQETGAPDPDLTPALRARILSVRRRRLVAKIGIGALCAGLAGVVFWAGYALAAPILPAPALSSGLRLLYWLPLLAVGALLVAAFKEVLAAIGRS